VAELARTIAAVVQAALMGPRARHQGHSVAASRTHTKAYDQYRAVDIALTNAILGSHARQTRLSRQD